MSGAWPLAMHIAYRETRKKAPSGSHLHLPLGLRPGAVTVRVSVMYHSVHHFQFSTDDEMVEYIIDMGEAVQYGEKKMLIMVGSWLQLVLESSEPPM